MITNAQLSLQIKGLLVKRWHTEPTLQTQTNGEHSAIAGLIAAKIFGDSSPVIIACLLHDCYEAVMGDIPSPFKWAFPDIRDELVAVEGELKDRFGVGSAYDHLHSSVKICDCAETALFAKREISLGNIGQNKILDLMISHIESIGLNEIHLAGAAAEACQLIQEYRP